MERLDNKKNERQRSQPEGQIALEKIDINVVAGRELRKIRRECEEEGTPLRFAKGALEYYEGKLLRIVLRRNNIARRRMSQISLGYDDGRMDYEGKVRRHSSELWGNQSYHEDGFKELLSGHYGWDDARIRWLLREMDEDITSDFRLALSSVVGDETARGLIPTHHIDADDEELQQAIDNCLGRRAKNRVDYAFDDLGHLERLENPRSVRDFERLVEIMEISANEAASRMPQMV